MRITRSWSHSLEQSQFGFHLFVNKSHNPILIEIWLTKNVFSAKISLEGEWNKFIARGFYLPDYWHSGKVVISGGGGLLISLSKNSWINAKEFLSPFQPC